MPLTADLRLIRVVVLSLLCLATQTGFAEESLHQRIDSLIEAKIAGQPLATVADDAEFLRRAFLDLVGRIPTTAEAREFLNDSAADKRERLTDRLLASDEFPRRMADLLHVLLMERRGEHPEWLTYLRTSFQQNKPWDVMVREMLSPDPTNEQTRAAAFFVSKRLEHYGQNAVEYPVLTRDVGRLFLGMDLQCAECHDHLFIKDYKQRDFQGLYVAFLNTSLRNDVKFPAIAENLMTGKLDFQSVFKPDKFATGPRVPGFDEVAIPTFAKGDFAPSLRASLFLMNDADLLKLLEPQPGNLLDRLKALDSAESIADELYLSILSRPPTADETTEVADVLQRFADRRDVALRHLAWALLASTEFCVNH